jgi:predicted  nucleic acid-binding Zn-ribbon protein
MADEDWSKQAWYTQALTVGMAALNTQLAEAEARVAVRNKLVQAGKQDQAAMNAVIDEEAAKTSGNAENGKRVIDALNKFREKAHADEKKRSTERKQIALENAQAELDIAAEYNQRLIKEASDTENEIARIKKKQRDANREWAEFWAKSDEKRENEIVENAKKAAAAKKAIQQKDNTDKLQMIDQMTAATTQAATAWASGEMKGADAAKSAVKGTVTAAIQMAAAKASAQAMAAYSGIPFVGVALGIAAAATLATMILGYLTKFHTGGVVGSGDGQRLPGMASNERAITVKVGEEVRTQEQQRAGSGGGVVINARSLFAPTAADTKRMVNQVSKLQRRQRRLGYA